MTDQFEPAYRTSPEFAFHEMEALDWALALTEFPDARTWADVEWARAEKERT